MSYEFNISTRELISIASNIKGISNNPAFTKTDFLEIYPQFTNGIPNPVWSLYINMANSVVSYDRWKDQWVFGMCNYIAHFLTIYLQTNNGLDATSSGSQVLGKSIAKAQIASKSASDLSISYDTNSVNGDLEGWAQFKLTTFGQQYASLAKLMAKGGIYVW